MKGIVLAGGSGSRLFPITQGISKQLLPVYDKPMIYYPISVLMLAGMRDILIISNPEYIDIYKRLLGDGSNFGLNFSYKIQTNPGGLADALILGEEFINGESSSLILGDNIFYAQGFSGLLSKVVEDINGATIFGYYVQNPREFGVINFDNNNNIESLEEKPLNPKSHWAIPGLYFYDKEASYFAKQVKPSPRGEIEITDLNRIYLEHNKLKAELLGRGFAWLDTGTSDGLLEASNFVKTIQHRQGLYIACLEEIAYKKGYINQEKLELLAFNLKNTDYGKYIYSLIN